MQLTHVVVALSIALQAQASVTWYEEDRRITCEMDPKGVVDYTSCVEDDPAEDVNLQPNGSTPHVVGIRNLDARSIIEKRFSCNLDIGGLTGGAACFAHCRSKDYCNAWCDEKNICHCACKDKTQWWNPIPCFKTSC